MKRFFLIGTVLFLAIATCSAAMSRSRVRKETRFLTDKMAYELRLNDAQYNDVYEINYDFIYSIRYLMDDVLRGYEWALDEYYDRLDIRNDDLRWVLSRSQYHRMMDADYFFRPIYVHNNRWNFRIHIHYTDFHFFYFPKPTLYMSYTGAHFRPNWDYRSYYYNRYHQLPHYHASAPIRRNAVTYRDSRRKDFGSVAIRPGSQHRPGNAHKSESRSSRRSTSTRHDDMYVTPSQSTSSRSHSSSSSSRSSSRRNSSVNHNTTTNSGTHATSQSSSRRNSSRSTSVNSNSNSSNVQKSTSRSSRRSTSRGQSNSQSSRSSSTRSHR